MASVVLLLLSVCLRRLSMHEAFETKYDLSPVLAISSGSIWGGSAELGRGSLKIVGWRMPRLEFALSKAKEVG